MLAGWMLGFIQLEFLEAFQAKFRGRTNRDGSILADLSHGLVRDTVSPRRGHPWYAHPEELMALGLASAPTGSFPPSNVLTLSALHSDRPGTTVPASLQNSITGQQNFLYHLDVTLRFVTFLAIQHPHARHPEILRHFYWNVVWEAYFEPTSSGGVRVQRAIHHRANVQGAAHTGPALDGRFHGRELAHLTLANDLARHQTARLTPHSDWA